MSWVFGGLELGGCREESGDWKHSLLWSLGLVYELQARSQEAYVRTLIPLFCRVFPKLKLERFAGC